MGPCLSGWLEAAKYMPQAQRQLRCGTYSRVPRSPEVTQRQIDPSLEVVGTWYATYLNKKTVYFIDS